MLKTVTNNTAAEWFYDKTLSLPVFVLSYDQKNNRPSGMICGWNMPCSGEPLRLVVAMWKQGYTHKIIADSKEFVVAIPNDSLKKEIDFFSKTHGDKIAKFEKLKIKTKKAKFIKTPLLTNATANFECRVVNQYDCGDHYLFIGEVLAAYVDNQKLVLVNCRKQGRERKYKEI